VIARARTGGAKPRLRIIPDPMANLQSAMLYRQVQYFVDEADWKRSGADVDLGDGSAGHG
jgi:hypothetical protein